MKKNRIESSIRLVQNPDILRELGQIKRKDQILVGFAAETDDVLLNGRAKLKDKNLDMLVLNDVSKPGAGFDSDTNIVRFLHRSGDEEQMDIMSKERVADLILDRVKKLRTGAAAKHKFWWHEDVSRKQVPRESRLPSILPCRKRLREGISITLTASDRLTTETTI